MLKLKVKYLVLCLLPWVAVSQDSTAVKYAETITKADLEKHLNIIAGDDYEGRETGKEGQKKAATYLAMQFRSLGIDEFNGAYFQSFPLIEVSKDLCEIKSGEEILPFKESYYCFPDFDATTSINNLLFLGYGINSDVYSDYEGVDVTGKWIVIKDGEPVKKGKYLISGTERRSKWSQRYNKLKTAEEMGVAGIIYVVNDLDKETENKYFKHKLSSKEMMLKEDFEKMKHTPTLFLSEATVKKILSENVSGFDWDKTYKKINKKLKPDSIEIELKDKLELNIKRKVETLVSENVLAYIEGSDLKDELIVITAHYDHIGIKDGKVYNGADDDGSGTVALIEIAEAFMQAKKEGKGPRRSILIMPVSGEEKGLLGSDYYTRYPVLPLENTVANLNIDMIGRLDSRHKENPNYIYLIGSDKLSTELHEISEKANSTYTNIELDYTYNDLNDPNRYYYRSDHYNFAKNNIPVIFYFNGTHEDYHKHTDTVEKIDYSKMENITKLIFYTAWELVNRDERIIVDGTTK